MNADDILSISSSFVNLQCMIDICTEYGLIIGVTFDHLKSNFLAIYPRSCQLPISSLSVNGFNLLWIIKMHNLRIHITNYCKNLCDVSECITKFYGCVHSMTALIGNNNELVACEILEKQCSPMLFYSLNAICIANNIRDTISKA